MAMDHTSQVQRALQALGNVQHLRQVHADNPALGARALAIKRFQQQRFARSYQDLLVSDRYGLAARFFLEELYGPGDKAVRDAQFAKVVPAVVNHFPQAVTQLVEALVSLHALSEQLDHEMAVNLAECAGADSSVPTNAEYICTWQITGSRDRREQQLVSVGWIGQKLDELTRNRWLRHGLVMMRPAAAAAGLAALQRFLEAGLQAFTHMKGADEFLRIVSTREAQLFETLYDGKPDANGWLGI
jgi:hypothetical protein